jgi:quinol monooxygenase YgiN
VHVQIVNFSLKDLSEDGYRALGAELAPAYGSLPGLLAKVWLASPETNSYGGVYLWEDRAAMERYLASDLLKSVMSSPHLVDITSSDFAVYEDITRATQPNVKIFPNAAPDLTKRPQPAESYAVPAQWLR